MQNTYTNPIYPYRKSADQNTATPAHHPVVIIGAGPGGLALSIDLALQGIKSVVLDDNNTVSVGSRAICFAKRTLEIMNRYGCGKRMVDKGITWKKGKVFFQSEQVYDFDLLAEDHHQLPAFINLQQYYFEEYLVDRTQDFPQIDLRWKNKVLAIESTKNLNTLTVATPDGEYTITSDYVLSADGANSKIRTMLGLESKGQVFQDRFLIADVVMKADFPTERWFWFDPPFHKNQSALLHRQADDVWRIDLQLGWDADPDVEKQEEVVRPRIEAMLGEGVEFNLEWSSVYTFQCRKMDHFIHNNVIFVGDAAHQVSPFGARGANGCIQSVDNLSWKLARVLQGKAPVALLETYNTERQHAANENIMNSTRSTDFITPKNEISRIFRDETLKLAKNYNFARTLVNSGRLSLPCSYNDSPLNSIEVETFNTNLTLGSAPKDAPLLIDNRESWLIDYLGNTFTLMVNIDVQTPEKLIAELNLLAHQDDLKLLLVTRNNDEAKNSRIQTTIAHQIIIDHKNIILDRYDLTQGSTYLFRPDQIITGRWKSLSNVQVSSAIQTALGFELEK